MNAQYVFKLPADQWDRQLAAIAETGVGIVREDAFWSRVEPSAPRQGVHRYIWTRPDAIIGALARNGLRWYPILDYSASWAGTLLGAKGWKSAPRNPAEFAAYAAAFAKRYGASGSFWAANPSLPALPVHDYEIWNEPNLADFWPDTHGAAARYGELLADTAPAIRSADPVGQVVMGGLSPTGLEEFLDEIEARNPGLIAQMDAVAFHPYGTTFTKTGARVRVLREWLDQHGAGLLPIEVTETGWATPPLSETVRATRMNTLMPGLTQSSCDISRIIPYTWMTFEGDQSDPEEWFGIANGDATLKPTGVALTVSMAAVMEGEMITIGDPCVGLGDDSPSESHIPESEPGPSEPESEPESDLPEVIPSPVPLPTRTSTSEVAGPGTSSSGPGSVDTTAAMSAVSRAAIKVEKRPHAVAVQVICPQVCKATVRLKRAGGESLARSSSPRLARRYRALLALPATAHGTITVRATVKTPGGQPQLLVRRLRRR